MLKILDNSIDLIIFGEVVLDGFFRRELDRTNYREETDGFLSRISKYKRESVVDYSSDAIWLKLRERSTGCIKLLKQTAISLVLYVRDGSKLIRLFQNTVGIKDENALKVAKSTFEEIVAQFGKNEISQHIQNYKIVPQDVLVQIAKLAAYECGKNVSQYIQNYKIMDQNALIEIAMIAMGKGECKISQYIQNYGLTDENALIEIAKLAAREYKNGISQYIHKYRITDPNALIKVAKLVVQNDVGGICKYIWNYQITDQEALIEIAKIAAKSNGSIISR